MKTVLIYTRVSTTDQKEFGHSLKQQEESLRRFCANREMKIIKHFQDDYSGKDFERPDFSKLLEFLSKNKHKIDFLLVTKWDRFSRDLLEALIMSRDLEKWGVEVNAIEQWINKKEAGSDFLRIINLAFAEMERKAIKKRTALGMRQAKKDGCWVSNAPFGYTNTKIGGKPSLIRNEKANVE